MYGHPRMSFLDAFQGYHQIALAPENQEKTAFISPEANYHYTVMPFGLKNTGATYQRMMTRMFRDMIGCTVEVYIDDIVVKSKLTARHTNDLRGVFEVLRQHRLRLNAEKCAFGVGAEKFLGYLITKRGIKVNPDQIEVVKRLKPPSSPKQVQVLTRMLAALNRFISKFVDRCRPFYQLLKKWTGFQWNEECDGGFMDLKDYLTGAPMLTAPEPGNPTTGVLHQQDPNWCRDEILTPRKACAGPDTRHEKAATILSGLYGLRLDGVSPTVAVEEVEGSFEARDLQMKAYLEQVKQVISSFNTVKVFQVARTQNRHADSLATLASSVSEEIPRLIRVEVVLELSIRVVTDSETTGIDITAIAALGPCWMDPIIDFLTEGRLPSDEKNGRKIRRMAPQYWLSEDRTLYRRSFGGPYLLCLHPEKVGELLVELHEEMCSSHVGGRSLAHQLAGHLNSISSPWPFAQWGLDIIGPFPQATGNRRFVLVAVDYFTKWAEAEALANIRDVDVKKFVWKNLITRFGVPNSLISDNGLQFDSRAFRDFCGDLSIKNRYSTPMYPQGNGQAEAVNKVIVNWLKKRLEGAKGNWAEELPKVLWAYRTTPRRSTGETPFSLTYGAEAVIPTEVDLCSARVARFDPDQNDEMMVGRLDRLEEFCEVVTIRLVEYQQKLAQRYSRDVRTKEFGAGDSVLRKAVGNMRDTNAGKLAQTWERPYRVTAVAGARVYYLEDLDERPLPRPWNVHNLKRFYH
nr:uncharacterized protein LOC111988931 [Quercus suber]